MRGEFLFASDECVFAAGKQGVILIDKTTYRKLCVFGYPLLLSIRRLHRLLARRLGN